MSASVGTIAGTRRPVRIIAGVVAVGVSATAIVAAGGGSAEAATINAQSVGRFLDGSAGGNPIQGLVDLKDARATAPGTTSAQNPLDIKAFNALDIPLTNAVKIPTSPAVDAGAVNQVATAQTNGKSLGAAGAVARDGGAELSSSNGGSEPDTATINLTGSALGSANSIAIPGLGSNSAVSADALGGVTGAIHSVYSRVGTARGGAVQTPSSGIAGLTLTIGSPALAAVLAQLKTLSSGTPLTALLTAASAGLGGQCALTSPTASDIKLASDAITISPTGASITVDVQKLISEISGKDISDLSTSNFDLVSYLVKNLPGILAEGVGNLVTSTTTSLATELKACFPASANLVDPLLQGQGTIKAAIDQVTAPFATAGAAGLTQLADGLKNIVDIGLNVQSGPGIEPREKTYRFDSNLDATPNQATDVVDGQTLVRAIEINILDVSAVPGVNATGGGIDVALANSAAGPSEPAADRASSSAAPTVVAASDLPTAIPAGEAAGSGGHGSPVLPLAAMLVLLAVSGAALWRFRTGHGGTGSHLG